MREIRKIFFSEKKRHFRHWLRKVGFAYGLAILTAFVARIFDEQKEG